MNLAAHAKLAQSGVASQSRPRRASLDLNWLLLAALLANLTIWAIVLSDFKGL